MIPLVYLLLVWLILMGIFALMALLSVMMNLKHGMAGFGTYLSTGIFLVVTAGVLIATGAYFLSVDWSQTLQLLPSTSISVRF